MLNLKEKEIMKIGILFKLANFWIGFHYSEKCNRVCINIIPCVTIWITLENDIVPDKKLM